jgi:hypothetical protein
MYTNVQKYEKNAKNRGKFATAPRYAQCGIKK